MAARSEAKANSFLRRKPRLEGRGYSLCENANFKEKIPQDLIDLLLPNLRIVLVEESASYELKNAGMQAARADLAVILDADCVPDPDWLRMLVNAMNANSREPLSSVENGLPPARAWRIDALSSVPFLCRCSRNLSALQEVNCSLSQGCE